MRKRVAYTMNTATTSLAAAREYAEEEFEKAGRDLDEELPDFDRNYLLLRKKLKSALDVPRIQMPVIEPRDIAEFNAHISEGSVDIFPPYARGKLWMPPGFSGGEGEEWINLGFRDGDPDDDVIMGKKTRMPVRRLLPTQSQIWFDKLIKSILKFGVPGSGSPILKATVIVSKEGYILDGHHRFGQAILADPGLALAALWIPLDIDTLLKVGKSYGEAIGNKPKASLNRRAGVMKDRFDRIASRVAMEEDIALRIAAGKKKPVKKKTNGKGKANGKKKPVKKNNGKKKPAANGAVEKAVGGKKAVEALGAAAIKGGNAKAKARLEVIKAVAGAVEGADRAKLEEAVAANGASKDDAVAAGKHELAKLALSVYDHNNG